MVLLDKTTGLMVIIAGVYVLFFTQLGTMLQPHQPHQLSEAYHTGTLSLLKLGQVAPDFTISTLNGAIVTRIGLGARPTIFVFFSTTCERCRREMPHLLQSAHQAQEAGFTFSFISGDARAATLTYIDEFHINEPVYLAPMRENPTFYQLGFLNTPFYCFIDEQGIVRSAGYPHDDWHLWRQLADEWHVMSTPT